MPELFALVVDDLGAYVGVPRAVLVPFLEIATAVTPWFFPSFPDDTDAPAAAPAEGGDGEVATAWRAGLTALHAAVDRGDTQAAATACQSLSLSLHMVPAPDAGPALTAALAR